MKHIILGHTPRDRRGERLCCSRNSTQRGTGITTTLQTTTECIFKFMEIFQQLQAIKEKNNIVEAKSTMESGMN